MVSTKARFRSGGPATTIALVASVVVAALVVRSVVVTADESPAATPASGVEESAFTAEQIALFEKQVQPILAAHCFKCHGGGPKVKGGLRLTSRGGLLKGGDSGAAIDVDKPDESLLLEAINYETYEMPPKGKLPPEQIDLLTRWVRLGAPWTPGDEAEPAGDAGHAEEAAPHTQINDETRNFWSLRPIERPEAPPVRDDAWVRTPIDAFLRQRLEAADLAPAPPVDKIALLRRATYDLTGLPPTPAEVAEFLADDSPGAYERVVDRLLASPHYGEKWGRHWLDLVHYAESNSFERDNPKPEVWRYRDYVIRAFNDDKPFDRFLREQLAGDELEEVTPDSVIATAYYRLGLWDDESADPPKSRMDELDDWVTVTGQVFLGLSMNCARCHDHKLDPIPQEDYYRLQAFFRDVRSFQNGQDGMQKGFAAGNFVRKLSELVPDEARKRSAAAVHFDDRRLKSLQKEIAALEQHVAAKLKGGVRDDFKYDANRLAIFREQVGQAATKGELKRYEKLRTERDQLVAMRDTRDAPVLCVTSERAPPPTHVKIRGNATADGKEVQPGFPQVLGFADPEISEPPAEARSAGRRRVLSDWLTDRANPLVARVWANRVWQHHFGRGIVRTPNDFGQQGARPTHPQLLDWLASELVRGGWRLKPLHRTIMLSSAYQMSARHDERAAGQDPANDLWWRFDMRRLTAEELRDTILAVNGRLDRRLYGPSVYPVIPREVLAGQSRPGQNWRTSGEPDRYRRSIYVHVKRSLQLPILAAFDAADTDNTCPVRFATTQPTQALGMLNSGFLNDQAAALAVRLRAEAGDKRADQVALALELATQRQPRPNEIERGLTLIGDLERDEGMSADEALRAYCLVVLNLNEMVYLD